MLDQVAAATESHRPLDPVLSEIERFFPQLAETDLLEFIQLQGRTETVSDSTQTRYCRDE